MKMTFAMDSAKNTHQGSWLDCLRWALNSEQTPVKIHKIRAGETNAKIIAEVDNGLIRMIPHGRQVPLRSIERYLDG